MTVTQSYSLSLTYTSLRVYLPQTPPATVPAPSENKPTAPTGDTVTLSPEATAPPAVGTPTSAPPEGSVNDAAPSGTQVPAAPVDAPAPVPAPEAPPVATSRAARRAEVLLDALDADQDGAVTKEEFVDGAMALLRRAGARHRHHHHHHHVHGEGHDRHGHESRGMGRLERKLDRLFDRVDAGGDGSVDQAELTDALRTVTRERRPHATETPAPTQETPSPAPSQDVPPASSSPETPAPATGLQTPVASSMLYTNVTVVIAVKQYTSVAAMRA